MKLVARIANIGTATYITGSCYPGQEKGLNLQLHLITLMVLQKLQERDMKLILMRTGKIPANAEGVAIAGPCAGMSMKKGKKRREASEPIRCKHFRLNHPPFTIDS